MSTAITTDQSRAVLKRIYRAFFSPSRYEVKPAEREIIDWGNNYRNQYDGGEVAVDQPGHGESDGTTTNLLEIAPTMDLIAQHEGPFQAVVAHSFGTLITSYALVERNFPRPGRLVYFGAFNQLLDSLPRFQVLAGLPDEIMEGFRAMLYENFGQGVLEAITNEALTPRIEIPALMFHDVTDNVTPIEDSRAIARVWKQAQFIETEGLGHRGALQSKSIHEQVVNFLRAK